MGSIVGAFCNNCGFKEKIYYGGGRFNHTTVCNVPGINKTTGKFEVRNFYEKDKLKDFIFYNDPEMYKGRITDGALEWKDIQLKSSENLCPNCKKFEMNFMTIGDFD